jgi:hypothetical protein
MYNKHFRVELSWKKYKTSKWWDKIRRIGGFTNCQVYKDDCKSISEGIERKD